MPVYPATSARTLDAVRDALSKMQHSAPPTPVPAVGNREESQEEQEGEGGAPSPTGHSAKHGAVTVAEAEAVKGPLPADHYGQGSSAQSARYLSHPGHLPPLPQPSGWCSGNRYAVLWASGLHFINL